MDLVGTPAVGDEAAVEHLLEDPRAAPGGVLLVAGGGVGGAHESALSAAVGPAFADPDAPVDGIGDVSSVVREGEAVGGAQAPGLGAAEVGVQRCRADDDPRVHDVFGVQERLEGLHGAQGFGAVHDGQQLGARASVPVLAGEGATVLGGQRRGAFEEPAHEGAVAVEGEVETDVDATVAEVAVGQPGDVLVGHQGLESAQVVAEAFRGDGGVLPARPGLLAVGGASGQAGTVGADLPEPGRLGPRGQDQGVGRAGGGDQFACGPPRLLRAGTADLGDQPSATGGQGGDAGSTVCPADDFDELRVQAFQGERAEGEQIRYVVRGGGHVAVAEDGQRRRRCPGDECDRGFEEDSAAAFGAGQGGRQVVSVLREQVLQGVAGDLPSEASELGAQDGQVLPDEGVQTGHRGETLGPPTGRDDVAAAGQPGQGHHVVGRTPVGQAVWTARVVADHSADGAAGGGGGIGTEAKPVRQGGGLEGAQDHPGFHDRRGGIGVDGQDTVHEAGEVDHEAGAHGVAGAGGASSPDGDRHSVGTGEVDRGDHIVLGLGREHSLRDDPVVGGIGRVQRPGQGGAVDEVAELPPQGVEERLGAGLCIVCHGRFHRVLLLRGRRACRGGRGFVRGPVAYARARAGEGSDPRSAR